MKYLILILVSLVFIDSIHAEGDSIQFKTMLWYSGIRKFPYDSIPLGAYQNAVDQKKSIRQQAGMFAGGNNPWLPLGPSPGVYNGYTAGRCQSVLFNTLEDPTGNTVYLVAANGGMWKTTNFWDTSPEDVVWQPLTWNSDVVEVLASGNFCIDPNDLTGKTIFYGTGEDLSYTTQYLGTGVYKSTNGGVNWIKCAGLPSATKVFKIVVRPGYPNEVIVALGNQYFQNGTVNCGMYRSTDGGVNFNIISGTENLECTDIVFDPNDNTRAYCAGPPNPGWEVVHGTDYRVSTDGGASFQRDPVLNLNQRSLISICKANSDIIYVLTVSTNGGNLIYKSVNRGLSYSYMCNVNKENYLFYSDHFSLDTPNPPDKPFLIDIKLKPIKRTIVGPNEKVISWNVGAPVVLKNVFFETGKYELQPLSYPELNRLVELLNQTPEMRIELSGHTDNVGLAAANQTLSVNRAKAVYNYLIAQGINANRLSYKGYGDTRPVAPNTTDEGRAANRRNEFTIL